LTFEGVGVEDFKKKFPATQGERKKSCSIQSRKKISCKRERSKKIPACKSTEAFHFSIVSTGLQDFAFLSRYICLKEHWVNSGHYITGILYTTFGASNI
jgi:hypothetical protein